MRPSYKSYIFLDRFGKVDEAAHLWMRKVRGLNVRVHRKIAMSGTKAVPLKTEQQKQQ